MSATTKTATTKIIELGELHRDEDFPAYAAVYSAHSKHPQVLSPQAMSWSAKIHLNRLAYCRQFWLTQKKKLRCKLSELFDPLLRHHYGENYLAVFGQHPWPCLLYLQYQREHGGRGLYFLQSRLDRNIYRTLGWNGWFAPQEQLAEHWLGARAKGVSLDEFRARQA
ncbi:MAG: hypothetical protein MJE77_13895, partial [Proteobacteria bacterium]|nr:hypothetical protein [Pseudomonadota bacterium]